MPVEVQFITQMSNKTIEIFNIDNSLVSINKSNEVIPIYWDTSCIMYIKPDIQDIGYLEFLSLSNTIFSGFIGYIWIILIIFIFYYLIRSVKNYVK